MTTTNRPECPECDKTRFSAHDIGCPFDQDADAPNRVYTYPAFQTNLLPALDV